ncbi:MAG: transglycosylase SLT domain-containing protein, partial [Candidatus Falkowbacteria bacterium]|nr:transglycosylase SLT domain-containing protein [Candidatus Falkowbacteria bacterium]
SQKEEIIEVEPEEKEEESVEPKVTFEWSKRNEEEVRTIQEIIKFSPQERIKFGEKEFNDLYKHHFHRLNNETDQKPELEKSYSQIQPWLEIKGEESIGNIFQREFIDKLAEKEKITDEEKEKLYYTYIALIIRESGGDPRALSPAGAAGMHQFMKSTGHEYHLQQNYNIDERFDPIKSATACANYLYELYNDYKSGDTSLEEGMCLTLHAYNGIVGNYVKEVQEKNEAGIDEKVTYQGYLRFIETEINNERDKIMRNNSLSQAEKEKAFNKAMKGYVENMNYVPYIMAARDTLLETAKQGELPTKKERIIVDRHMEAKKVQEARVIKIQQGDTISSLAKRHGVKPTKILKLNPDLKVKKMGGKVIVRLRVGQPLIIEGAEHTTLLRLAKGNGKVLNDLITLNPQIINFRKEIPDGTKIRIGKMIESA